ncbi:CRISPR-associated endonuclease Cas2 [Caloramator sp. ALD01]|uniref:CRISPR-associated endonuclease Cas2 n=1 Tax=Caloramator sp. ALD01 TaxID=1031288 RepID=UPI00040A4CDD|nr:CRISPR-associated endonuclease Cas2 [Caloramator sp. ALD01]
MIKGIVAYDITNNRYRNRLSKILENYAQRVQYSLFEFELPQDVHNKMLKDIEKLYRSYITYAYNAGNVDELTKSIRIYYMCEGCINKRLIYDYGKGDKKDKFII